MALLGAFAPIFASQASDSVAGQFTNGLGMRFVKIPAGTFLMGSDQLSLTRPVHKVTLSAFYLMATEVTNAQFERLVKHKRNEYTLLDSDPVSGLRRGDVLRFISLLNKRSRIKYSLPTEAQWEYAARGGLAGRDYPWGNDIDATKANIGPGNAKPVGSYAPNGFGLYDMCGNVAEQVLEVPYDYKGGETKDPVGPTDARDSRAATHGTRGRIFFGHIERGIGIGQFYPQVWFRDFFSDDVPNPLAGFRLVARVR